MIERTTDSQCQATRRIGIKFPEAHAGNDGPRVNQRHGRRSYRVSQCRVRASRQRRLACPACMPSDTGRDPYFCLSARACACERSSTRTVLGLAVLCLRKSFGQADRDPSREERRRRKQAERGGRKGKQRPSPSARGGAPLRHSQESEGLVTNDEEGM